MGLFDRFFGRGEESVPPTRLVANDAVKDGPTLQLVFPGPLQLNPQAVQASLRGYHREMARAACELDPQTVAQGTPLGLAGWGRHVVRLVGFNAPMPPQALETSVGPSHYGEELKQQVRRCQSHLLLFYAGYETDPLEQYVALAAVAGCFAPLGAPVVLNENARTSVPIGVIAPGESPDMLTYLRDLPLLLLYAGLVKGEVPGIPGVWMRTFGCPILKLPDLAMHTPGHEQGQTTFDMFCAILSYIRTSGAHFAAGHTSQVGENEYLRFRAPAPQEAFLYSDGSLLVAERITAAEINR